MGRRTRKGSGSFAPDIFKIEVSDKHVKARLIAAVIFFVISVVSLGYAVSVLTGTDKGWQFIAASGDGREYAAQFVLSYELGASDRSARSENREIKQIYSGACLTAGRAFDTYVVSSGNIRVLNDSPNEVVELDSVLYEALELMEQYGNRAVYLGPAFRLYENVFSCTEDWQLEDFDPAGNEELGKLFEQIVAFARDPDSVRVELLGENKARLCMSEEYLSFLEYEELSGALDFGWMKNAFITDFIADSLISAGYTRGSISSYDGYTRNMDGSSGTMYSLNIFDDVDGVAAVAARLDYRGAMTFVSYRDFPVTAMDSQRIYVAANGERKTLYLSMEDGLPCAGADSLTVHSDTLGCAEILLLSSPVFLREKVSDADLAQLAEHGVEAVLAGDRRLFVTDAQDTLAGIYDGYEVEYMSSQNMSE
ncbi:MAG: hypothetical protein NC543_02880 [bacterium]|nr:hypothetical protein [bacterium]MCM1375581.1 hypothetical protein [Muribaculum sp.]